MNHRGELNKVLEIQNQKKSQSILSWDTALYTEYERGKLWYFIAGLIAVSTILLSLFFGSKTFALVILVISVAYILLSTKDVPHVKASITPAGVRFGDHFHNYEDIEYFWIEKHLPNFQSLHLIKKTSRFRDIEIQFYAFTDTELINTLQRFVPYNPEKEPGLVDHLVHVLKL